MNETLRTRFRRALRRVQAVWRLILFAIWCVPGFAATSFAVPPVSQASFYTNKQNVRRVVAGDGYVAFATSGGLRVWDGHKNIWREWTMHEGLASHNVVDLAFDPAGPPGHLWVLSAAWNSSFLYLTVIDLTTGDIHTEYPCFDVPPGIATGLHNWTEWRMCLAWDVVLIYGSEGGNPDLVYDRRTKQWRRANGGYSPSLRPDPRAGNTVAGPLYAVRSAGKGRWLLVFRNGLLLCDPARSGNRPDRLPVWRFALYPWLRDPNDDESSHFHSVPTNFQPAPSFPGDIAFDVIAAGDAPWYSSENYFALPETDQHTWHLHLRLKISNGLIERVSRTSLSIAAALKQDADARKSLFGPAGAPFDRMHDGQLTDAAFERGSDGKGKALWFTTYNHPGIMATGIARYDLSHGTWSYPDQKDGLSANEVNSFLRGKAATGGASRMLAYTTNGRDTYDPGTRRWYSPYSEAAPAMTSADFPLVLPERPPRYDSENRPVSMIAGGNIGNEIWVRVRVQENPADWKIGRMDRRTKDVTLLETLCPPLGGFTPLQIAIQGTAVWYVGIDSGGQAAIARWKPEDSTAGGTVFHQPEWQDDKTNFAGSSSPSAYIFVAAGCVWTRVFSDLYRFDDSSQSWHRELVHGVGQMYSSGGSLWAQPIASPNAHTPGTLIRWPPGGSGWQRLVLPPEMEWLLQGGVLEDSDSLWLYGIGIARLPVASLEFAPYREP